MQAAQSLALSSSHQQFSSLHLLKVLLDDPEGLAASLLERSGARPKDALLKLDGEIAKLPSVSGGEGQLYLGSDLAKNICNRRKKIAEKAGDSFVTVERLLLAMTIEKSAKTSEILLGCGLTPNLLNKTIEELRKGKNRRQRQCGSGL